jgi:hypothetical protein
MGLLWADRIPGRRYLEKYSTPKEIETVLALNHYSKIDNGSGNRVLQSGMRCQMRKNMELSRRDKKK